MRFTVIGHACLLVEADGARLVIDPWLVGSCYWRSWWHHPPSRPDLVEPERVSAIYYTHEHPRDLTLVGREYYTRSFAAAVRAFRPRYAVPFASNVRHLHPESRAQNAFMVPAAEAVEACRGRLDSTEVVRMDPGDAWDREKGFSRPGGRGAEPVTAAEAQASGEEEAALARYMTEENAIAPADAAALGGYLETFLGSIPWPLRRAYAARVAFALGDGAHLVADVRRRRVSQVPEPPSDVHSIARVNPRLLRDAVDKRCLNLVGISKRIEAHLKAGGLLYDAAFWGFLALYELEYLPMRKVLTPRAAAVLASRWREFLGYVRVFLRPSRSLETILDTWALE